MSQRFKEPQTMRQERDALEKSLTKNGPKKGPRWCVDIQLRINTLSGYIKDLNL